jgi:hypothetical protein
MQKNGKLSRRSASGSEAPPDFDRLMQEKGGAVDRSLRKAVREALRRHKLLGQSVVIWRNGKMVELKPEEI